MGVEQVKAAVTVVGGIGVAVSVGFLTGDFWWGVLVGSAGLTFLGITDE